MNHEDYEKAANYWKEKDKQNVRMPEEQLKKAVDDYIFSEQYLYPCNRIWRICEMHADRIYISRWHILDVFRGRGKISCIGA